jgi:hypothetical protein
LREVWLLEGLLWCRKICFCEGNLNGREDSDVKVRLRQGLTLRKTVRLVNVMVTIFLVVVVIAVLPSTFLLVGHTVVWCKCLKWLFCLRSVVCLMQSMCWKMKRLFLRR